MTRTEAVINWNEVNAKVGEHVMGWTDVKPGQPFPNGTQRIWGTPPGETQPKPLHNWVRDLNRCQQAELRMIELGHGDAYCDSLMQGAMKRDDGMPVHLAMLTAKPGARCLAMLRVLEQEPST